MKNKKIAALLGILLAGSMAFSCPHAATPTILHPMPSPTPPLRTPPTNPAIPALMTATAPASKRFRSTRSTPIRMLTL